VTTRLARATTSTIVSLCRQRVRRRLGSRLGWLSAVSVALFFAALGASLDVGTQANAVLGNAIRWLCWLGAGPVVMSVAASPRQRDREEGILAMAALHGASEARLTVARFVAASLEASLRIVLPALLCSVVLVASGQWLGGPAVVLGVVAVGLMSGVVLGTLGAACGLWARERGRLVVAAVVLLPWAVADQWSVPALSIPGALDAAIAFFVGGGP
jgi:hypothetical protein